MADFVQKLSHKESVKLIELLACIHNKTWKRFSYTPLKEYPNHYKIQYWNWRIVFYQKEHHTKVQNIGLMKSKSEDSEQEDKKE